MDFNDLDDDDWTGYEEEKKSVRFCTHIFKGPRTKTQETLNIIVSIITHRTNENNLVAKFLKGKFLITRRTKESSCWEDRAC